MHNSSMLTAGLTDSWEAAPEVAGLRTLFVNVAMIGRPGADWILVDAGLGMFAGTIRDAAQTRFGVPPKAIVLTHGHFDHVGTLKELLEEWDIPVYAHPLELPYITGQADYPRPDPSVGGGMMAVVSPLYPHRGIDIGSSAAVLPEDGSVPGIEGWRWIHTPGHCPGHVSLFRDSDRTLIAGDAFITVRQESAMAVVLQDKEVHGPPAYFTPDWKTAKASVRKLAELSPRTALTGHGLPIGGAELSEGLARLAAQFDELAVPDQGKYVP